MTKILYSALNNAFYSDEIHREDQIPADAVEISTERHQELLREQRYGATITPDVDGQPGVRPIPTPTRSELIELAKDEARAARAQAFATLDGLQVSALVKGNKKRAERLEEAKQALRDITKLDVADVETQDLAGHLVSRVQQLRDVEREE